jgi:hypothetical protein
VRGEAKASDNARRRLLRGARQIADYISRRHVETTPRRVYYLADHRLAPIGREGEVLLADPDKIDEHYSRITDPAIRTDPKPKPVPAPKTRVKRRGQSRRRAASAPPGEPPPLAAASPHHDD